MEDPAFKGKVVHDGPFAVEITKQGDYFEMFGVAVEPLLDSKIPETANGGLRLEGQRLRLSSS